MNKILNFLIKLIYPNKCIFCKTVTDIGKEIFICENCQKKLVFCENSLCCKICGKPQVSLGEKRVCYTCLTRTYRTYKKAASVVKYDPLSSSGIRRYKDGNNPRAGEVFASLMAKRLDEELPKEKLDCIVGVAVSQKRRRTRGVDPVDILCENISKLSNIPYYPNTLVRIKNVPKQSSLKYSERMKNLIGAIDINKNADVEGKTVLLIDDVMTTGATVNECGYILKENRAKAVYVLTFATTIKEAKTYKNK